MNSILAAFILTLVAGLSTVIGSFFLFLKQREKILIGSLSFASGVMLSICFTDLIPESYKLLITGFNQIYVLLIVVLAIFIGIIFSSLIAKYIPEDLTIVNDKNLYRVGKISMIAIIIHNIPEGIATFLTASTNFKMGLSLALAIIMHNIPEGITISVPIYYASNNKIKAFFYTLISGLSEFLGATIAYIFLADIINDQMMGILLAIIAGIMLHISYKELLPTSKQYHNNYLTYLWFYIGIAFMLMKFIFNY